MKQNKAYILLFVFLALFLTGCAGGLRNIKPGQPIEISQDKSVVFGKFAFKSSLGAECHIIAKSLDSGKVHHLSITDGPLYLFRKKKGWTGYVEKDFYVQLPPGEYKISKIQIIGFDQYNTQIRPNIWFTVAPDSITYIGSLRYRFEEKKNYYFVKKGICHFEVYDESERAIKELREKYPGLIGEVKVELMKLQQNI